MTDGDYQDEVARLRTEIEALKADNAALVETLTRHSLRIMCPQCEGIGSRTCSTCGNGEREILPTEVFDAITKPRPGAALLESHRQALIAAAARHETTRATMAVREEAHRKALEAARYADDNAKAFTQAFCETAEAAVQHAEAPRGGQHVPFHGDFANVPPSTIARLRWWAACGRAALSGETSALLVRAKNAGLEKAAGWAREHNRLGSSVAHWGSIADCIDAMKEAE